MCSVTLGDRSEKALLRRGATLVRKAYEAGEERGARTDLLRELAEVVVELRRRYPARDGSPDWAGRSWDYRQTLEGMYAAAGIPGDDLVTIQNALRYHVGNLLRATVDADDLQEAGLLAASPRDRITTHRHEVAALMEALRQPYVHGGKGIIRMMRAATYVMDQLIARYEAVGGVDPEAMPEAVKVYEDLMASVERVRIAARQVNPDEVDAAEERGVAKGRRLAPRPPGKARRKR